MSPDVLETDQLIGTEVHLTRERGSQGAQGFGYMELGKC